MVRKQRTRKRTIVFCCTATVHGSRLDGRLADVLVLLHRSMYTYDYRIEEEMQAIVEYRAQEQGDKRT